MVKVKSAHNEQQYGVVYPRHIEWREHRWTATVRLLTIRTSAYLEQDLIKLEKFYVSDPFYWARVDSVLLYPEHVLHFPANLVIDNTPDPD